MFNSQLQFVVKKKTLINLLSGIHHYSMSLVENTNTTFTVELEKKTLHNTHFPPKIYIIRKIQIDRSISVSVDRCQRPRRNPDTGGKCRRRLGLYAPVHIDCNEQK